MEAIFDKHGDVVSWLSNDIIYDLNGTATALIEYNNVFSFPGKHLGVIEKGYFRDHAGHAVGFLIWAHEGPKLPERGLVPRPPEKQIIPYNFGTSMPPIPSRPTSDWSPLNWQEFTYGQVGVGATGFEQLRTASAH
ncbi:4-fold beta flower protein [Pleionea sp. CnH1-48]|uniref:4-fold beta flower protein n=1 Tax=Pleionea sp. CnH1-48 TaxID=2954494 RepID=UPI002097851C|nr:hypothetical protein [Pleionea sp. CnH1-48]MCO7225609.1 hypothetical protein [Pleionea sp. CnH1-48]